MGVKGLLFPQCQNNGLNLGRARLPPSWRHIGSAGVSPSRVMNWLGKAFYQESARAEQQARHKLLFESDQQKSWLFLLSYAGFNASSHFFFNFPLTFAKSFKLILQSRFGLG